MADGVFRHIGNGSIGRLVGKKTDVLATDIFLRTVGFRRAAELELKTMMKGQLLCFSHLLTVLMLIWKNVLPGS